jgi:hypothetical protein
LEKAVAGNPSGEMRRQVEGLLKKLKSQPIPGELLRCLRAIDILEHVGTREASTVLEKLAKGAPGALQTQEAQTALSRLKETRR